MLNITREVYNTGALNATKFPDESKSKGVAMRNLVITLGAQINDGANADVYIPQRCKLLSFILVGTAVANSVITINNGNLRIAGNGGNLAAGTTFEFLVIEKAG